MNPKKSVNVFEVKNWALNISYVNGATIEKEIKKKHGSDKNVIEEADETLRPNWTLQSSKYEKPQAQKPVFYGTKFN